MPTIELIAEIEALKKQLAELTKDRDDLGECVSACEDEITGMAEKLTTLKNDARLLVQWLHIAPDDITSEDCDTSRAAMGRILEATKEES